MTGTEQPDIAGEIQQAVRDAANRVPTIVIVGLIMIAFFGLGVLTTRKR